MISSKNVNISYFDQLFRELIAPFRCGGSLPLPFYVLNHPYNFIKGGDVYPIAVMFVTVLRKNCRGIVLTSNQPPPNQSTQFCL